MFKFSELKQIHLEISNNCQASCPMCARNVNGGLENPLVRVTNWTLEEFKTIMNLEVLKQIDSYYFCGNYGDPILNNDLIQMCCYSSIVAPDVEITIHTNGSARTADWWRELAVCLPKNHRVVFAIDGLGDTHTLYRVGTDFHKILENAQAFIAAGGQAEWMFIRFKHNQHQVPGAEYMAMQMGFKKFTTKDSSRFLLKPQVPVMNRDGKIMHYVEPAIDTPMKFIDRKTIETFKEEVVNIQIDCKVQKDKEVYIDAHKNLYPCCHVSSIPYLYRDQSGITDVLSLMLEQHNKLMSILGDTNTIHRSIREIVDSEEYQTIWERMWTTDKMLICAKTCGVNVGFSQPRDQWKR